MGPVIFGKIAIRRIERIKMILSHGSANLSGRGLGYVVVLVTAFTFVLILQSMKADGFIKFGYILNTTACDICDELTTYSGRNVFCCLAQSKCCG